MNRICPKCGFENPLAAGGPTEACPKCGVIYTKAEVAAQVARPSTITPTSSTARRDLRLPLWPTIACLISLFIGFFIGREQMRYQIASAVSGAFANAFSATNTTPDVSAQSAPKPSMGTPKHPEPMAAPKPEPISAKLVKKGFRDRDFSGSHIVQAAITFTVEFTNDTDKDIRAFDGVLAFSDLLGNRINAAKLTISDPIKAHQSFQWQGELEYNQFISAHTTLRGYALNDTAISLRVHKILFVDGTSQTQVDE